MTSDISIIRLFLHLFDLSAAEGAYIAKESPISAFTMDVHSRHGWQIISDLRVLPKDRFLDVLRATAAAKL